VAGHFVPEYQRPVDDKIADSTFAVVVHIRAADADRHDL